MKDEETGLVCEDCGKPNAYATVCPYMEEICEETVDVNLCPGCYHERCMDI